MSPITLILIFALLILIAKAFGIVPFGLTALTADFDCTARDGRVYSYPIEASKKIYQGAIVVLNAAGNAEPATTATNKIAIGRARSLQDNTSGSAGDLNIEVEAGVFRYNNSAAADAITKADIGRVCYLVDDNTVAKTNGTYTRSKAGLVVDVDTTGVWVDFTTIAPEWPAGVVALADAAATLTAAQMIGSTIFTITPSAARVLTTDTAANLVAAMRAKVGDTFQFTVVCLAAFAATVTAGAGVTVTGVAAVNNVSGSFVALFTNVGTGTEAVTIYRM